MGLCKTSDTLGGAVLSPQGFNMNNLGSVTKYQRPGPSKEGFVSFSYGSM